METHRGWTTGALQPGGHEPRQLLGGQWQPAWGLRGGLKQKIGQHFMTRRSKDRFGVKLHPFHRMVTVAQSHNDSIIGFSGDG